MADTADGVAVGPGLAFDELCVHGWIDGTPSTDVNYPCGTVDFGGAVADLVCSTTFVAGPGASSKR